MPNSITKLAVYGQLKRGFGLDLSKHGGEFLTTGIIEGATLYAINGGVGLRFGDPTDPLQVVHVELFNVPEDELSPFGNSLHEALPTWDWLDYIEGNGHLYSRRETRVRRHDSNDYVTDGSTPAWVYEHVFYPDHMYNSFNKIKNGFYTGTKEDLK